MIDWMWGVKELLSWPQQWKWWSCHELRQRRLCIEDFWAEIRSLVLDIIKWRGLVNIQGFPGSSAGKESTCNAGDHSPIPGSGRSTEERIAYLFQHSGLENSMDCIDSPWGCKESDMTERLSLFGGLLNILGYTRPNLRLGSCEHIYNIWCRKTESGTEGKGMKQKRCNVRDPGHSNSKRSVSKRDWEQWLVVHSNIRRVKCPVTLKKQV